MRAAHRLGVWVRHLACNAAIAPQSTVFYALDRQLRYAPVEDAIGHLRALVALLRAGWSEPLPFFPRASCAYAEAAINDKGEPGSAARRQWESGEYSYGESEDPWFALAFRDLDPLADGRFEQLALAVYAPMLKAESNV